MIPHFHIDHNAVHPQKFWHSRCFQFLPGITVVPREIEDKGYKNFFSKQYYGLCENGEFLRLLQVTTPISILDRKSTRLNSSHPTLSRMPSSA